MTETVGVVSYMKALLFSAVVGLIGGYDSGVIMGAFAGSAVFMFSAQEIKIVKRWILFIFTFYLGVVMSKMITGWFDILILKVFEESEKLPEAWGSAVGATFSVRALMFFSEKNRISKILTVTNLKKILTVILNAVSEEKRGK